MMLKNGWCGKINYAEGMMALDTKSKESKIFCPCSCTCSHCGKELKDSSKFCSNCGHKIG